MLKPTVGIQLYTLRDHIQTAPDFDRTLQRLAAMGVTDVQISAIGDIPAEVQRDILQKNGMRVCVTHKSFERMQNDLPALIKEHETIGCDAIGLGSAPREYRDTAAGVRTFISIANDIGRELKKHGMAFHYHNHDLEFKPLNNGQTMMDLLLTETDPETFRFIPDVMWIHYAGADPVEVLRKMRGRVKVIHFKDYILTETGERRFVPLGEGRTNLHACYDAACELDMPYIMYEQDADWDGGDPFRSTEISWRFLQSLGQKEA